MQQYTTVVIDDEPFALDDTWNMLHDIPSVQPAGRFSDIPSAYDFLRREGSVDLILCDIEMPGIHGLAGPGLLNRFCRWFVYITGHDHYARQAFETFPDGCLFKPLEANALLPLLTKFSKTPPAPPAADGTPYIQASHFMVFNEKESRYEKVSLDDITYLQAAGDFVAIHAPDLVGLPRLTLTKAMQALQPSGRFIRISQSYIVAVEAITGIDKKKQMVYVGDKSFRVTEMGKAMFKAYLNQVQLTSPKQRGR